MKKTTRKNVRKRSGIVRKIWTGIITLSRRFQADTPKVARWVRNIAAFVSGLAMAVMTALITAQAVIPEWFNSIYPYLIGLPAAVAFACQFSEKKMEEPLQSSGLQNPAHDRTRGHDNDDNDEDNDGDHDGDAYGTIIHKEVT